MLSNCSYSSYHAEPYLRCHILYFKQCIIIGAIAKDSHHNAFCPVGIPPPQTFHRQCRHTSCKDRHGYDSEVILMDIGQLNVSGLDA